MPTIQDCDNTILTLRRLMHGRHRTDLRRSINQRVAKREHLRETGKMRQVLSSLLGVIGGRKYQTSVNLDVIRNPAGEIACSPAAVHDMITSHFKDWYASPATPDLLHTNPDWKAYLADLPSFQASVCHTGVPPWASALIYDAITNMPQREATETELSALFASPPTYSDFSRTIRNLKNNSAPGMSGLSYNMIKAWPDSCKQMAYECLSRQWTAKHVCPSWRWRWLVPIPKKHNDLTLLSDLRPLMLIEALRKIWTKLIVDRVQKVWHARRVAQPSQHGCQANLGTSTASILHIDSIDAAQEANQHLHRSSWDKSRAFDSVSKTLMRIAWYRYGVPEDVIDYLVDMDIDGPIVARTPHAAATWANHPYACSPQPTNPLTPPMTDPVSQLLAHFTAARGTGQGDVTSPAFWNAVFDILLTALQRDEEAQHATRRIRTSNQTCYSATETAYVDDLMSGTLTAVAMQRKADIVSAFCLITGISISMDKLRRVLHDWQPKEHSITTPDMLIHTYGWTPQAIPTKYGTTKYLGVDQDIDNSGKSSLDNLLHTAKIHCATLAVANATDTTKLATIITSTLAKERYTGKLANLTLAQYRKVDQVFNSFLNSTTHNLHGFPSQLLHLPWQQGGLDIPQFTDEVQLDKYQILLSSLQAHGPHHHAIQAHLHRMARANRHDLLEGQGVTLYHPGRRKRRCWLDSLVAWMEEADVYISRNGCRGTSLAFERPIIDLLDREHSNYATRRRQLAIHGLWVLADIWNQTKKSWDIPDDLDWLPALLPTTPL